jgi:MoaA/NifB/PqqE/SkfB family radical SAM enzyme
VFHSLGNAPFWVTISGGEPFIRKDLVAFVRSLYGICRPSVINIPTNGLLTHRIPQWVAEITRSCPKAQIIVNLSVDELGSRHDEIRGVQGSFKRVMETFHALRRIPSKNLTVGFHTVISRFNVDHIADICDYLSGLKPDSYVAEIAEEREELETIGADIAPDPEAYERAADYIVAASKRATLNRMGKIARAFRMQYHWTVSRMLKEHRQVIRCYAGVASAQIASDGTVWACCTRAESMGNLRENGYDFRRIWFSQKAAQVRRGIKEKRCWCPMANVSYTNMLFNPRILLRVGIKQLADLKNVWRAC